MKRLLVIGAAQAPVRAREEDSITQYIKQDSLNHQFFSHVMANVQSVYETRVMRICNLDGIDVFPALNQTMSDVTQKFELLRIL